MERRFVDMVKLVQNTDYITFFNKNTQIATGFKNASKRCENRGPR